MQRQKTLPLDGEQSLEALWEGFPEEGRREVTRLYARLMAAAVRGEEGKEENDEGGDG
jgi:hypothetical protein